MHIFLFIDLFAMPIYFEAYIVVVVVVVMSMLWDTFFKYGKKIILQDLVMSFVLFLSE